MSLTARREGHSCEPSAAWGFDVSAPKTRSQQSTPSIRCPRGSQTWLPRAGMWEAPWGCGLTHRNLSPSPSCRPGFLLPSGLSDYTFAKASWRPWHNC